MEKKISTVIFDFGNVLIDLDIQGFYDQLIVLTGVNSPRKSRSLGKIMASYEQGLISTELFINDMIKFSRRPVQALDIVNCWNSILVGIRPKTLEILLELRPVYKTYILSNTNALHIQWVYEHLEQSYGVKDFENSYLHGAFYSHLLQLAKPDLEIYHKVQSLINVPSEEIFFIDDREENVAGALDAGWKSVIHSPGVPLKETLKQCLPLPE